VLPEKTLQLTAAVTGASNTSVTWSVNGILGGNATSGTISAVGMYIAPTDLPAPANVKITASLENNI
jgi:hypothetical protein